LDRDELARDEPEPDFDRDELDRDDPEPDLDALEREEPEPDRDEPEPERAELDRDELERDELDREDEPERDEPEPERDELDFDEPDRDEPEPDRDELERDRDVPEPDLDRDELERDEPEPDFEELERERDELELLREPPDELELRELLDERRRELDDPLRRSAAGISSRATAFASCGICFWRKPAIRSSSRRIDFASFAVSLSPTLSASASIAVYWPISWNSSVSSVRAFFHIISDSPVPRSACSGPCAAATALLAREVAVDAASVRMSGPGADTDPDSALPPSCLMRRST
jgi:hypothetical protein